MNERKRGVVRHISRVSYHELRVSRMPDDGVDAGGAQPSLLTARLELPLPAARRGEVHLPQPAQFEPGGDDEEHSRGDKRGKRREPEVSPERVHDALPRGGASSDRALDDHGAHRDVYSCRDAAAEAAPQLCERVNGEPVRKDDAEDRADGCQARPSTARVQRAEAADAATVDDEG